MKKPVFDAAIWENVTYDLHLSESFEKVGEETFQINIHDTIGFDEAERIADIGLIELCPVGFGFQGPGPALEHNYPMTVTVEGDTSEFELYGSFASTYLLVSDEETFVNNLYEGKTMSIEIPFSRYKYNLTIDGTGFQEAYDEFRLQTGLQPYQGNS